MSINTVEYANQLLEKVAQLEAENARLRQQRDAANAQIAMLLEGECDAAQWKSLNDLRHG